MTETQLADLYRAHLARLCAEYGRAIAQAGFDALAIHSGTPRAQCDFDDQYWPLSVTPPRIL